MVSPISKDWWGCGSYDWLIYRKDWWGWIIWLIDMSLSILWTYGLDLYITDWHVFTEHMNCCLPHPFLITISVSRLTFVDVCRRNLDCWLMCVYRSYGLLSAPPLFDYNNMYQSNYSKGGIGRFMNDPTLQQQCLQHATIAGKCFNVHSLVSLLCTSLFNTAKNCTVTFDLVLLIHLGTVQ